MTEQRRQVKRYGAALRKDGACRFCIHGVRGPDGFHCRNAPEKARGACMETVDAYPRFQVIEDVLEEFKDGA